MEQTVVAPYSPSAEIKTYLFKVSCLLHLFGYNIAGTWEVGRKGHALPCFQAPEFPQRVRDAEALHFFFFLPFLFGGGKIGQL